jgi:myo-inositol-1(or 4)-monophosphatase
MSPQITTSPDATDAVLLTDVVAAVQNAGTALLARYTPGARPDSREALFAALSANERVSADVLRAALSTLRPGAGWVDEGLEAVPLPDGEWWVVDAVEGNVNHVHGMPEWGVTATLVRDNVPVLAVVNQPVGNLTYTAMRGNGAQLNGHALHTSAKTDLSAALAATGQAEAGQTDTYPRIAASVEAMLERALLVRATVPSTFPMLLIAEGHIDVFWQYESVLPGIAAGALLIAEAGGRVTGTDGQPWRPGVRDVVAAAPGIHAAALDVLSNLG